MTDFTKEELATIRQLENTRHQSRYSITPTLRGFLVELTGHHLDRRCFTACCISFDLKDAIRNAIALYRREADTN